MQQLTEPLAGRAPELSFRVEDVAPLTPAVVPTLCFRLAIDAAGPQPIRSVMLQTQLQIAARRRGYDTATEGQLFELFGEPERWGTTLRTLPWAQVATVVPGFSASTTIDLAVPCTYDFEVTASRYLLALPDGDVPLELLFSGTLFYADGDGRLQAGQISWNQEASYAMPIAVWREAMDRHFPGCGWLRVGAESFARLASYRSRHALATWDDVVESLLEREAGG